MLRKTRNGLSKALMKSTAVIRKLFLDTNILVDLIDENRSSSKISISLVRLADEGQIPLCCSALSIANLPYILRKQPVIKVEAAIRNFIDTQMHIQDLHPDNILEALNLQIPDIEDAFQWAAAKRAGASHLVTNDGIFLETKIDGMPLLLSPKNLIELLIGRLRNEKLDLLGSQAEDTNL